MAIRSFEEQVRAELGALRLRPDEQVWLHVEAALHKDKKRRWLIWLFIGVIGTGALGLYYYHQPSDTIADTFVQVNTKPAQPTVLQSQEAPSEKNKLEHKPEQTTTQLSVQESEKEVSQPSSVTVKKEKNNTVYSDENKSIGNKIERNVTPQSGQKTPDVQTAISVPDQQVVQQKNTQELPEGNKPTKTTTTPSLITAGDQPKESVSAQNTDPVQKATDSIVLSTPAKTYTAPKTDDSGNTIMVSPQVTTNKKQPWRLFVSMDVGASKDVTPLVLKSSYAAAPPSNAIPGNGNGSYYNGAAYKEPSMSGGFSFGLNLNAIKAIGRNTDIGFGLGYQRYQTRVSVGRQMNYSLGNSSPAASFNAGSFYLSSDSVNYNNNWHFAELAIDLYRRMSMGGSTTLRWRIGLAGDLLLASNALYYNKSTAVLYEDDASRHKLQLNISTGFDLGFGKQQSFYIGPQFTYFFTPSSGNSDYHFFRTALRAGYLIPKRKK
jgi:hypothetical protein